ncbi:MAG: Gfo/Idh/MocA family oxidoreductase [Spirochaetes bacterium]|nr:Gfo/Idh/MocA family oxidoreductase [Spirochaetota bacterium]
MSGKAGIGIVGAKFAGSFHVETWRTVRDAEIVAVSDIDDSVREEFMKKYSIPKGYHDYNDLVTDSSVEIVDVCVPNFLHAEVSIAAMNAGKNVVCEKPFATNLSDGEKVVEISEKTGVNYFYAEDWIFAPALVRAKAILDEGAIGRPLYFKGRESHGGSHSPFAQKIRFCGGGSMIHLAIHPAGYFYNLLGMPETVMGRCSAGGNGNMIHPEFEGEDWGIGVLGYGDGTQATIEGNYITHGGMDDTVEIYGTEGIIRAELTFGSPLSVFSMKGYSYAVEKAEFTKGWTRPAVDEHQSLGYKSELNHFLACIKNEEKQIGGTKAEAGFNVLRIIDAVYRSNREGKVITLGS